MFIAMEVRFDDSTILMVGEDQIKMENLIIQKFSEVALPEDELVLRPLDGADTFTIRRKIIDQIVDSDGFEYEDNDGNPIRPDGSPLLDSQGQETEFEEHYEVPGDFYWVIKEIELNHPLEISTGSDLYTEMTMSPTSPFEDEEQTTIVTTA